MKKTPASRSFAAGLVAMAVVIAGCGSDSKDSGGPELRSGMDKSRSALVVVDRGIAAFRAGDRSTAMAEMEKGMSMMTESMGEMRAGLGMMSMEMMNGCGGTRDGMMRPLEGGVAEMRAGHSMMIDDDAANDGAALARMEKGRKGTEDAMNAMGGTMSCMGHGSMGMM